MIAIGMWRYFFISRPFNDAVSDRPERSVRPDSLIAVVTITSTLQFVKPPAQGHIPLNWLTAKSARAMSSTQVALVSRLFAEAVALSTDERSAYLDRACAGDARLREEVTSLLAAHAPSGEFERMAERIAGRARAAFADQSTAEATQPPLDHTLRPDLGHRLRSDQIGPLVGYGDTTAQLVRRRLLTLSLVFALLAGLTTAVFFFARVLPLLRDGSSIRPAVWIGLTLYTVLVALSLVVARVLSSSRPLSLQTLRTIEVAAFSLLTTSEVWRIVAGWRTDAIFRHVAADAVGIMLLSSRQSLIWFAVIVAYGVFVPNTWRRCALVVGTLGATPIVTSAICNVVFDRLDGGLMSMHLFNLTGWMIFACAVAIYGSHRIEVLRHEALEARELRQYQLKQLLGAGGMGEVYLAEHILLRRPCAIKLIRPDRAGDSKALVRFEREVQATATLTHPNTVHIYDYGHTDDGTFYYVMEYLPGVTLEELIRVQGPLPAARAVHLLRQICGALGEAHAAGLIHRDVKPGNIIVCERGGVFDVAKLVDFGIVQSRETATGEIVGTPSFMSPEQVSGTEIVDERSDLYSLGGVGYFLLTGVPPFLRATAAETAAAHVHAPVVPPGHVRPDVPADLQSIILRCLSKGPDQRYPSAAALDEALAEATPNERRDVSPRRTPA